MIKKVGIRLTKDVYVEFEANLEELSSSKVVIIANGVTTSYTLNASTNKNTRKK